MPDKETIERAKEDKREGKSASTQAGEFVRREIDKIREGEHGAKNAKQAIAIGLSEARRAGVDLPQNPNRRSSAKSSRKPRKPSAKSSRAGTTKRRASASRAAPRRSTAKRTTAKRSTAKRSIAKRSTPKRSSKTRARAALRALKKMPRRAASHLALSRQAHGAARRRTKSDRSAASRKAARTRAANRASR
jgi:hypothetical protein